MRIRTSESKRLESICVIHIASGGLRWVAFHCLADLPTANLLYTDSRLVGHGELL